MFALDFAHALVFLGIHSCSSSWALTQESSSASYPSNSDLPGTAFPFAPISDNFRLCWLKILRSN